MVMNRIHNPEHIEAEENRVLVIKEHVDNKSHIKLLNNMLEHYE